MIGPVPAQVEAPADIMEWEAMVDKAVVDSLPKSEVIRQKSVGMFRPRCVWLANRVYNSIIHRAIFSEEQYIRDLDLVESDLIKPLRMAQPPVFSLDKLDDFIHDVFGNILDLRECNRRLLEVLNIRRREQAPIIHEIGDIFLEAATKFRSAYVTYIGHLWAAEKRMSNETETNPTFRLFLEVREYCDIRHNVFPNNVPDSLLGKERTSELISSIFSTALRSIYNNTRQRLKLSELKRISGTWTQIA